MRDGNLALGLIETANLLANRDSPTEADLRRAISSCYFAVFHALAKVAADSLIGKYSKQRPNKAWIEVYRRLKHATCRKACVRAKDMNFPKEIHALA